MKTDVNFNDFCDSFGESYKNNFTYDGKKALYEYLLQYEEETGTELELDPIALCCEYSEYENFEECKKEYSNIETMKELENHTMVIPITDINGNKTERFIIQQF